MGRFYPVLVGLLLTGVGMPAVAADGGSGCGQVTIKGCCHGSLLFYCAAGQLQQQDCSAAPSCGWDPALNFYGCSTAGGDDPSGKHPQACPGLADAGSQDIAPSDVGASDIGPSVLDPPTVPVPDTSSSSDLSGADLRLDQGNQSGKVDGGGCSGCSLAGPRSALTGLMLILLLAVATRAGPRLLSRASGIRQRRGCAP